MQVARASNQIVADILAFQPAGGNWLPLDHLAAEQWASGAAGHHVPELLAVFERFPDEAGALWGVLHGLESLPGYEPALVRSVRAQPSEMAVTILGRLLNAASSTWAGCRWSVCSVRWRRRPQRPRTCVSRPRTGYKGTPNQALQQTAGHDRLSEVRSSLGPRRC